MRIRYAKTFACLCGGFMHNYWGDRTDTGLRERLWSIRLNCQKWRSSIWCTYCKHRCAAVVAHT